MMNRTSIALLPLILILCLTIGTANAKAQAATDIEAQIKKIIAEYDDGWNRKDANTVAKFLASGYTYFSSTGGTTSREKTLEFLRSPKYILRSAKRSELFPVVTENTVIVGSRWVGNGSYNDESFNDDQRCSLVFTREKKEWKLLSEHCTQIVSK